MNGYVVSAVMCFIGSQIGLWNHNMGAATGWGLAAILALKLWAEGAK